MTCAEVAERTVDFLYRELSGSARQAFDAHLSTCAACRAQVEALAAIRGRARTAVRESLAEDPPARVRARVLAAAATAGKQPTRAAGEAEQAGFWYALRRPWVVPAFAVASVMAVFVLVRQVVQDPDNLGGAFNRQEAETALSAAESPPPAIGAPEARHESPHGLRHHESLSGLSKGGSGRVQKAESRPAPKRAPLANPTLRPQVAPAKKSEWAEPPPPPPSASSRMAEAHEAAPAALAPREPQFADLAPKDEYSRAGGTKVGVAGVVSSPEPGSRNRSGAPAPATGKKSASLDADRGAAPTFGATTGSAATLDELVQRADRAFQGGRWGEAVSSYKELVRGFPHHKDIAVWKRRLTDAQEAAAR